MYHSRNTDFREKTGCDIALTLVDQGTIDAVVYLALGQRLCDLLNDDRAFLPVRRTGGEVELIAKTRIAGAREKTAERASDEDKPAASRAFDPYVALRVAPTASDSEVHAAYKERIKSVHPDKIESLGLDDDLKRAALMSAQKVNYAYQKIMRLRETARG